MQLSAFKVEIDKHNNTGIQIKKIEPPLTAVTEKVRAGISSNRRDSACRFRKGQSWFSVKAIFVFCQAVQPIVQTNKFCPGRSGMKRAVSISSQEGGNGHRVPHMCQSVHLRKPPIAQLAVAI